VGRWLTPARAAASFTVRRCIAFPSEYRQIVAGALYLLTQEFNWEQFGNITPAEAAADMQALLFSYLDNRECGMIGEIKTFARDSLPDFCLPMDGAVHDRADYPELYEVIPLAWKISSDTFVLPDLAGYALTSAGEGLDGVIRAVGETYGEHEHTLMVSEMPAHSHGYNEAVISDIDLEDVGIPQPAIALTVQSITDDSGDGEPFNVTGPRVALLVGIVAR